MAAVRPAGVLGESVTFEVLLPAYLANRLTTRVGENVTLRTLCYLEGQGQGTSFLPRLIGFASEEELAFFDLFTTVKGIGNRKALRALAEPPGAIAGAIVRGDTKALTALPEIGKRLAETMIAELKGKVDAFASAEGLSAAAAPRARAQAETAPALSGPAADAVEALVRLGEQRSEAERKVVKAMQKHPDEKSPDRIVALVFAGG